MEEEEIELETKSPAEVLAEINARIEETIRLTREEVDRAKRYLEMRRLRRRAERYAQNKKHDNRAGK